MGLTVRSWSNPARVWPSPQLNVSATIPAAISSSLEEARTCLVAGAYTASVAMTGRALEGVGRHFHTKGKADRLMLGHGLEQLHAGEIIDKRLFEWGKGTPKKPQFSCTRDRTGV
jgi:hypothetical protein